MGGSRSEVNRSEGQSVSRDEDARLRIGGGGGAMKFYGWIKVLKITQDEL